MMSPPAASPAGPAAPTPGRAPFFRGVRGAVLLGLVLLASLGCCWDVFTLVGVLGDGAGGDGLGNFFPIIGAMLFAPMQLLAVIAWTAALVWRSDVQDADARTRPTHERVARGFAFITAAALGVPALVMGVVTMLNAVLPYSDTVHELLFTIAEPGTLLWAPMWAIGMLLSGISFGRYRRAWPMLLMPLYPIAGALYMFSGS